MLGLSPGVTAYILFLTALLGLCMGSFVNCMACRLARGESVAGRSHCPSCGHVLGAWDLVPVASFVLLRGRCRYCGVKLSPRYLLVELLTAVILLSVVLRCDVTLDAARYAGLLLLLLTASLVDLESGLIPDRLILMGIGWFLLTSLFVPAPLRALGQGALGGLAAALPLLLLVLLADKLMGKETMGGGDIKLFFMAGLYLDWQRSLLLLILACVVGLVFALAAKKKRGVEFPFGPAIAAACWLVVLFGAPVVKWYVSLLSF